MPEAPGKLVILAPNWLGDAVMALPLLNDLRGAWTATAIAVAARRSVAPLFAMVRAVDSVITLSGNDDVNALAGEKFDAALLLPNSFASAWLVKRAGIRERWGFARDLRASLLTTAIKRPRSYGHQVEYYQALGAALGIAPGPPLAPISVSSEQRAVAAKLLVERGLHEGQPFVVFAPGAAYGRAKQWLPSRFAELARMLADDHVATVLVGAKSDIGACREVASAAPAIDLAGHTDLGTLAGLLSLSHAVVANDSGAMHLAAAVGARVTAVFGPTNNEKTAPLRASLESPEPRVVHTNVWCRPCMLRECPIDHRCMTRISAARVYETVQSR